MILDAIQKAEYSSDLSALTAAIKKNLEFLWDDIVVDPDNNSGVSSFINKKGETKEQAFVSVYRRDPDAVGDLHIGFLKLLKGAKKATLIFIPNKERK